MEEPELRLDPASQGRIGPQSGFRFFAKGSRLSK
jgi:hypothetical protein